MRAPASLLPLAIAAVFLTGCRTGRQSRALRGELQGSRRWLPTVDPPAVGSRQPAAAWDWNGVVGTGQSLAVGDRSGSFILTSQPFHNLKLALGAARLGALPFDPTDPSLSPAPLVEPIRTPATSFPGAYPSNIYGETPHTAMADEISSLYRLDAGGDYVTVHSVVGESGQGIEVIGKSAAATATTGHAYAATLFEVAALKRLSMASGKTYGVAAVVLTHGETDAHNAHYEEDVMRLRDDYNRDIAAITGQTTAIPILYTQQQTSPGTPSMSPSLVAQWLLGVDHPAEFVCAGPKYQYPYAADHLHLLATGYDWLGEKYGEVYYEVVVLGRTWQPLEPIAISRSGPAITVQYHVPVPPLAWDETLPAPHQSSHRPWAHGRGFEVEDRGGEETIDSVELRGSAVVIVLARSPRDSDLVVRYAMTQDGEGTQGGLATGRIGQLRDSNPRVGFATRKPLYNYALSFVAPVN